MSPKVLLALFAVGLCCLALTEAKSWKWSDMLGDEATAEKAEEHHDEKTDEHHDEKDDHADSKEHHEDDDHHDSKEDHHDDEWHKDEEHKEDDEELHHEYHVHIHHPPVHDDTDNHIEDEDKIHVHIHNRHGAEHHKTAHQNYLIHIHEEDEDHHDGDDHHDDDDDHDKEMERYYGPMAGTRAQKYFDRVEETFWPYHQKHKGEGPNDYVYGHCNLATDPEHHDHELGRISFKQNRKSGRLHMKYNIHGLTGEENHDHALNVHEYGFIGKSCDAAGDLYDPFHDHPEDDIHGHAGYLGKVHPDEKGDAHDERDLKLASFTGPYSIVGRAIVMSKGEEEDASRKDNAFACCVVTLDDGSPDWHD